MKFLLVCIVTAFVLTACAGHRPPFHPVKDDPTKHPYEIYASDQSYAEVVDRMKGLVVEQKWLSWVTRSTDCMEMAARKPEQWMFACGGRAAWCDWCTKDNPYHVYSKWGIVEPGGNGATVKLTIPITPLFYRHHPNTEILDKAGIRATSKGTEPYK